MTTNESRLAFFENVFFVGEIAGILGTMALFIINMLGNKLEWNGFATGVGAFVVFMVIVIAVNRIAKHFLFRSRRQKLDEVKL